MKIRITATTFSVLASILAALPVAAASEFNKAWKQSNRALIIDGYEHNEIDLIAMSKDQRIAAFIHKGSDGLPAVYRCKGNNTEKALCKEKWRRYVIARELYHTRRALAKTLGMKWGAYHLARPNNPLDQARHFLDYTNPSDDEAIVLDIEDNDPDKWMSLEDAETFSRYIYRRLGRWPMLYTNGSTAKYIANNKDRYKILSRLPLWYARYKPDISDHFPKGHWDSYHIWQFQAQNNCSKGRCPYNVKGANRDIDVNVVNMDVATLRENWPFDSLVVLSDEDQTPDVLLADLEPAQPVKSDDVTLINNRPSDDDLVLGYVTAAAARGAPLPSKMVDRQNHTAAIDAPKLVNDLF